MTLTLSTFRARVAQALSDTGNVNFSSGLLDESIRSALHDYSRVLPLAFENVLTLPGDGREIALSELTGLLSVSEVWWPYDSAAAEETWPPNRVRGFRLWWDDARPVLFLDLLDGDQPQADEEIRVWYTALQTIQDLDSATTTTVMADHESGLVLGASAYAALSRSLVRSEKFNIAKDAPVSLFRWGETQRQAFVAWLERLRSGQARSGKPWADAGWKLDKWDV